MADKPATEDLQQEVEDTLTLNESESMISAPRSEDDLKDTVKLIARNLDKMSLKFDRFVARIEDEFDEDNRGQPTNSAEKSVSNANGQTGPPATTAVKTEEEIKSAFLASPIGNFHVELNHELHKLRKELEQKTAENKMLHGIIQQAQTTPEITDEEVERRFRTLRSEIERFSRTHFQQFNPHFKAVAHMRSSSHPLWVEATIADDLDAWMFMRPIFGHNCRYEDQLADFEKYLLHKDTPSADVHLWVAETVKLTSRLEPRRNHAFADFVANKIVGSLEDFVEFSEPTTVYEDMRDLCRIAYDLALVLRQSRTRFIWIQSNPTTHRIDEELYAIFHGYDEVDTRSRVKPFRVRFGPVLKTGSTSSVIIRKGELLSPSKR